MDGNLSNAPAEDHSVVDEARLFGLDLNPADLQRDHAEECGIWACNLGALDLFLSLQTQWRVLAQANGSRFYIGLDYGPLGPIRDLPPVDFHGLRHIEAAARDALNER